MDNPSGNVLRDYYLRSSPLAKYCIGIPEKKFDYISKLLWLKDRLRAWLTSFRAVSHAGIRQEPEQESISRIHSHFPGKRIYTKANTRPETEWVPLIKEKQTIKSNASQEIARGGNNNHSLAGQAVLCVGGRATLYPDYLQLVEAAGGRFIAYRGSPENNRDHLYTLLDRVSMVICPVDCVSHDDYFAVKRYCKLSGRLCVFLERSSLPAFSQGLRMLILQLHGDN
ncbi:DUF2325 domain-containing protein [Nitrosomonas sp. Is37]|uniref:DUF2325 domain-containing protein n=1 Tax=Nitrosomonas sp. Is37 TaxID=3080535 RepID=UPI00294B7483|nr:DUF2325 domain-containing protein [Nitrosomonas sp. Is37]MDV6343019.1 DUF2325 domain-containing protein [Nitrosomonas sp. Is37]